MVIACCVLAAVAVGLGIVIVLDIASGKKIKVLDAKSDEQSFAENTFEQSESDCNKDFTQHSYNSTEATLKSHNHKVQSVEEFNSSDIRTSVRAQDVDNILTDEVAAALVENGDSFSDKTRTGIINIDILSQCFVDGETVTLDEIKKRINGYSKTTYIKVLARGTLDKRLIVEADDFSLQAVKMIVLLGGKAIKKQ